MILLAAHSPVIYGKPRPQPKGKDMNTNDLKLADDVSALSTMVGGTHYTKLAIQPAEFAMTQGYDFCAASILKYLSRHESKNGRQDAEKALHFAQLRVEIVRKHHLKNFLYAVKAVWRATGLTWVLSTDNIIGARTDMEQYILVNGFTGATATSLRGLDMWVTAGVPTAHFPQMTNAIEDIIASYDSTDCGDNNHV